MGSLSLLQGIFPTQGSNPGLPHCRWILYLLSHQGSPRILDCIAYPFSRSLPDPGIEPGSPALQTDSLPAELPGKPKAPPKYSYTERVAIPAEVFVLLFNRPDFSEQFSVHNKTERKVQKLPIRPPLCTCITPPLPLPRHYQHPPQSRLATVDEPVLTRHITRSLWFTLGFVHFMGLDKHIMTGIHHYSIIQSSFTALEILCAVLIISPPFFLLFFLSSPSLYLFQNVIELESYSI